MAVRCPLRGGCRDWRDQRRPGAMSVIVIRELNDKAIALVSRAGLRESRGFLGRMNFAAVWGSERPTDRRRLMIAST